MNSYGISLIEAIKKEKDYKWSGVVFTDSAKNRLCELFGEELSQINECVEYYKLKRISNNLHLNQSIYKRFIKYCWNIWVYLNPLKSKNDGLKEELVLNWAIDNNENSIEEYVNDKFFSHNRTVADEDLDLQKKIDNTVQFLRRGLCRNPQSKQ